VFIHGDIASLLLVLDVVNEMFKDNLKQLSGKVHGTYNLTRTECTKLIQKFFFLPEVLSEGLSCI
jgi:hypothetical protein